ncbi:glycosyl transferase family 1 [Betaproteobacteria bacterium]|nr:glycosyl transferase family 1 [Betaproteobacteria bacterium]GHU22943.1 glycosyl transferase family 1 [Betaproteobacteria bacterium]GHU27493.1 glycosyl transferase family 1 [Betaproteobacteria bacterium]
MKGGPGRRHILHCVYSFDTGGLEHLVVALINRLPVEGFEHTVLALTRIGNCRALIERDDVRLIALDKPAGHALRLYPRIFSLLRQLAPDVVHSCNMAALEVAPLAWLAGVRRYVHAEHGWDMNDLGGSNPRYLRLRRFYRRFVDHQIAVSANIRDYLTQRVGVRPEHVSLINNGVELEVYAPRTGLSMPPMPPDCPFEPGRHRLIGTVGRFATVKNQVFLARAFARAVTSGAPGAEDLRLIIVGEGEKRGEIEAELRAGGVLERAWLPGVRDDVPRILPGLDCFVLPSYSEGTSLAIQEAMACGLPVLATAVGGTPDLVTEGESGFLVRPDDDVALAGRIVQLAAAPELCATMGARARRRAERDFDIRRTIGRYGELFNQ